jgi:hypothetical protein
MEVHYWIQQKRRVPVWSFSLTCHDRSDTAKVDRHRGVWSKVILVWRCLFFTQRETTLFRFSQTAENASKRLPICLARQLFGISTRKQKITPTRVLSRPDWLPLWFALTMYIQFRLMFSSQSAAKVHFLGRHRKLIAKVKVI